MVEERASLQGHKFDWVPSGIRTFRCLARVLGIKVESGVDRRNGRLERRRHFLYNSIVSFVSTTAISEYAHNFVSASVSIQRTFASS